MTFDPFKVNLMLITEIQKSFPEVYILRLFCSGGAIRLSASDVPVPLRLRLLDNLTLSTHR